MDINNKKINCVTRGISDILERNDKVSVEVAKWIVTATNRISVTFPDFIVACPKSMTERLEDEGRTLILPIKSCPKCYAVYNETGGVTFLLADEY